MYQILGGTDVILIGSKRSRFTPEIVQVPERVDLDQAGVPSRSRAIEKHRISILVLVPSHHYTETLPVRRLQIVRHPTNKDSTHLCIADARPEAPIPLAIPPYMMIDDLLTSSILARGDYVLHLRIEISRVGPNQPVSLYNGFELFLRHGGTSAVLTSGNCICPIVAGYTRPPVSQPYRDQVLGGSRSTTIRQSLRP